MKVVSLSLHPTNIPNKCIPNAPKSIQNKMFFLLLTPTILPLALSFCVCTIPNERQHERNLAGKFSASKVHVFDVNIFGMYESGYICVVFIYNIWGNARATRAMYT